METRSTYTNVVEVEDVIDVHYASLTVPVWLCNRVNMLTEWVTLVGTLAILLCNLSCLPVEACISFWNLFLVLVVYTLIHSGQRIKVSQGTLCHLLQHAVGLFLTRWLWHILQTHYLPSTFTLFLGYLIISGIDCLIWSTFVSPCLYHSWSQRVWTYTVDLDLQFDVIL